ncbi:MAG: glycerate kinase [Elusimicrobiota bacterium]|nr:MAG: glycerate kinase [Elusimicrobiota bacterium]
MKVLVAPNAFKGSLSCADAARAMARGVRSALRGARVTAIPVADGGDGLIDALRAAQGGALVSAPAHGPLGERRRASYLWISGKRTAVIEMARASGLALVAPARRRVMAATTRGTGDLMRDAVRRGARTIIVGMGGSASNDGGAGMARALGARLLDCDGRELPDGAADLPRLCSVDARAVRTLLSGVKVIALSDVTNPLLGPKGSARVFGPQKGASPAQVRALDRALAVWARALHRDLGVSVAAVPGAGAAGGSARVCSPSPGPRSFPARTGSSTGRARAGRSRAPTSSSPARAASTARACTVRRLSLSRGARTGASPSRGWYRKARASRSRKWFPFPMRERRARRTR